MPLLAQDIINRAAVLIQDTTFARNPQAEMLGFLNDGRREVCAVRPDIYSVTETVPLVAGTKQSLPQNAVRLLDVTRNITATTVAGGDPVFGPGRAIRIVEREIMDAQKPDWHIEAQSRVTKHFMYDERNPTSFFVYPPATAQNYIEMVYAKLPENLLLASELSQQEELYSGALVDYVCYRSLSKDTEYGGGDARVVMHYQQFINALGLSNRVNLNSSPNMARVDGVPPRAASIQG